MPGSREHGELRHGGPRHAPGQRAPDTAAVGGARAARAEEARIADAIRPVVTASGMDLESVRVSAAGRRRLLRVVVDSDGGVSLDDAAAVSRELSSVLDKVAVMGDFPYTLEVSSPGVDRPLTEPRHWRRATGRLVTVTLTRGDALTGRGDELTGRGDELTGRIVRADDEAVILDTEGVHSRFPYDVLGAGAIQVEFGRLADVAEQPEEPDGH